jgi:hypothetical protein
MSWLMGPEDGPLPTRYEHRRADKTIGGGKVVVGERSGTGVNLAFEPSIQMERHDVLVLIYDPQEAAATLEP